jgi:hypothetical protein
MLWGSFPRRSWMEWFWPHGGDIVGDHYIPVAVRRLPYFGASSSGSFHGKAVLQG